MGDGLKMFWHYLIQFLLKEVDLEKMLSINVEVSEIPIGENMWGNIKAELSGSKELLIESKSSYFDKSILRFSNKKIIRKIFYLKCRMFIYATCNHINDTEQIISKKVNSVFPER